MKRSLLLAFVACVFTGGLAATAVAAGSVCADNWDAGVDGIYKGEVGFNNDTIIFTFSHVDGKLAATYTIDDPAFSDKPYKGKLMKFSPVEGKPRTLACRYEDEMNAGSYELTFSEDLKSLTGKYVIDGEEPDDGNTVSAKKQ